MKWISKLLHAPFASILYIVTVFRNYLYDNQIVRSIKFSVPIISIGNLTMGGTGKTPHIDFLINLLSKEFPLGVMSRGYRRKTKGFLEVKVTNTAKEVGDEPLLLKWKHPNIDVAVSESRGIGIPELLYNKPNNYIVLLDDAFQHRQVTPGLNILLTRYDNLYVKDSIFPIGNLRESKSNASRADIIIVSNCPKSLSLYDKELIIKELKIESYQKVFFSYVHYNKYYRVFDGTLRHEMPNKNMQVVLVTGIANPLPLYNHLKQNFAEVYHRKYIDHYTYSASDIESIINTYKHLYGTDKCIITTEKYLTRLHPFSEVFKKDNIRVYCLPISVKFVEQDTENFSKAIHWFVKKTIEEHNLQEDERT